MDALENAGVSEEELINNPGTAGTMIGTSLGPQETSEQATTRYRADETKQPSPLPFMNSLPNMPAFYISQLCKIYGTYNTITAACASGTQAIGMAADMIRSGRAAIMVTGAVESLMTDYMVGAFSMLKALADGFNDRPEEASRPFDLNRKGFVISEGCGIVILESLSHALKRGATIYAEILGYASSADAYHIAAIDPKGYGAMRAMQWALDDAHVDPKDIDYINAHGTSTKYNDEIETMAIKHVLGEHAYEIPVSSTKSMLGHALGASGALEVIACTKMLNTKIIPPTINYTTPDPECDLDYVPNTARQVKKLDIVLSNSFGLGGQNASIVLGKI
jgi:3-oxoacyl-[acyl-carrier-protein] synthase II